MANPRNSAPEVSGSRAAVEEMKMTESKNSVETVVPAIAPVALPEKINEAASSYSEWLTARGIALDPATVQAFWNFENVWRTSPERVTEREQRKLDAERIATAKKVERETAQKARLVAQRAALAKKAAELGLSIES